MNEVVMGEIRFKIDGQECVGTIGQTIYEVAKRNGIYIPTLCHLEDLEPVGACRICSIRIKGTNKFITACTTPLESMYNNAEFENNSSEVEDFRKALIEMFFVEGNHLCPTCEKSGNCELQALAYRYQITAPRYNYLFPKRGIDASFPKIMIDNNRCIQCLRCIRAVVSKDKMKIFGFVNRGRKVGISADAKLADKLTDKMAKDAMDVCPVGAILKKGRGFEVHIGKRKYDKKPIGF